MKHIFYTPKKGNEKVHPREFNLPVLIAKIQTVLRRLEKSTKSKTGILTYKDLLISLNNRYF